MPLQHNRILAMRYLAEVIRRQQSTVEQGLSGPDQAD